MFPLPDGPALCGQTAALLPLPDLTALKLNPQVSLFCIQVCTSIIDSSVQHHLTELRPDTGQCLVLCCVHKDHSHVHMYDRYVS